jgi:HK97 gp10 family phage protein
MSNQLKVEGLRELNKTLQSLPNKVHARVLKGAVRRALLPIQRAAKQSAPRKSGDLKKAIGTLVHKRYSDKHHAEASVSVRRGKKFPAGRYGHMVEKGTSKMPAKPFMRPAFDANKQAALDRFKKSVAELIEKELDRLTP